MYNLACAYSLLDRKDEAFNWLFKALDAGFDDQLAHEERKFLYMPFQHSESLADQQRSLDLFTALGDPERVLEERHHPEPEEIHLDDAHGRAVVLVPLDDGAVGHGRGLERHHAVEPPRADDHAPRMLAEMAGQILDSRPEMGEVAHDRLAGIAAGLAIACSARRRAATTCSG